MQLMVMDTVKIVIPALPCDLTNYVNAVEAQGAEAEVKHSEYILPRNI